MRAAISLLVLLLSSMCGAQSRSTQTEVQAESQGTGATAAAATAIAEVSTQVDIYAELKELRDMVVEQRVILKSTQDELKIMEAENAAMKERLVVSETEVLTLTTELTAVTTEMVNMKMENAAIKERLATTETKVEVLERLTEAQEAQISTNEATVEELKLATSAQEAELAALRTRLAATETDIDDLEEKMTHPPKVAFSAGLTNTGHIQAGNTYTNLVFSNVVTNVGQAYSPHTGAFTAPVRGVYYFRFNVMDFNRSGNLQIKTLKNGKQVMYTNLYDDNPYRIQGSNGLTLLLEVGDTVNLQLHGGERVYDDGSHYNNFSGFLLFTL